MLHAGEISGNSTRRAAPARASNPRNVARQFHKTRESDESVASDRNQGRAVIAQGVISLTKGYQGFALICRASSKFLA